MDPTLVVAIGTTNPTKAEALKLGLSRVFPSHIAFKVFESKVRGFQAFLLH